MKIFATGLEYSRSITVRMLTRNQSVSALPVKRNNIYFILLLNILFKIETENENLKRLLIVKNICKKYNLGIYKEFDKPSIFKHPPAPQYSVFYIIRSRDLSYCPIYKAGSTTWIYNLCLLMNVTEEELNNGKKQISTIARGIIPELEFPEAEEIALEFFYTYCVPDLH
ncbi:uncharacterized protein LOC107994156 isoform X4 [Apis cerana]|uniref:uncharacterized protein LOC107994156 isoform X4 n=1 Tax=Apis cerana TaxID=7461 RepID=UPI002B22D8C9|nr:uncharacterized protein LOC107994156 isoform X4 [Apis cerana]